jgi:hypothetical protein
MNEKEIKDYLKRVDELGTKLTGEDKETYAWLIYGYNQCAKLLNETEQQCKKQQEVIDKAIETLEKGITFCENDSQGIYNKCNIAINREKKVLDLLKEVE